MRTQRLGQIGAHCLCCAKRCGIKSGSGSSNEGQNRPMSCANRSLNSEWWTRRLNFAMRPIFYGATRVRRPYFPVGLYANVIARGFTSNVVEGFTAAVGNTPLVYRLPSPYQPSYSICYRSTLNHFLSKLAAPSLERQNSRIQVVA